jgi:hypothetical protein
MVQLARQASPMFPPNKGTTNEARYLCTPKAR